MIADETCLATSKTWTWTIDLEPGPWKTCTLKNLDHEKRGKQLDAENRLKSALYDLLALLPRRDLQASHLLIEDF